MGLTCGTGRRGLGAAVVGAAVLLASAGCETTREQPAPEAAATSGAGPTQAVAEIRPLGASGVEGQARFTQLPNRQVRVEVRASGLKPGAHGAHIHEKGDCSTPQASGGHFDPAGTGKHGHPSEPEGSRHAGDLPALDTQPSDQPGTARLSVVTGPLTVEPGSYSILDRAIVIHADPDDHKTNPAGNAGARIACGVIQAAR